MTIPWWSRPVSPEPDPARPAPEAQPRAAGKRKPGRRGAPLAATLAEHLKRSGLSPVLMRDERGREDSQPSSGLTEISSPVETGASSTLMNTGAGDVLTRR